MNDLMNISAFKGLAPAQAFSALDPHSESLSDGIGSSYGIVGYKGKIWTLRLRGETYRFNRPDDGTPAPFLDVIVLRQMPNKSKSYYPAGSFQDGAAGTRPICASLDGVNPDADVQMAQSTACAICPRNVFKTGQDGRKTRECNDYKRLAVLILPSLTQRLLGAPLMEPVFLRVPPASLNDLSLLGDGMSAQGFHFSTYVTRIGFNPDKPHPQMMFRALALLTDKEGPLVMPLRDDPQALRITGESELNKPKIAASVAASNVTPLHPHVAAVMPVVQQPVTAPVSAPEIIDTGFGAVAAQQAAAAAAPVATTVVSDTGVDEEGDPDLDARVNAMLQR